MTKREAALVVIADYYDDMTDFGPDDIAQHIAAAVEFGYKGKTVEDYALNELAEREEMQDGPTGPLGSFLVDQSIWDEAVRVLKGDQT